MTDTDTTEEPWTLEPLTPAEITELARDVVTNRVFISGAGDERRLQAFMILMLASLTEEQCSVIGAVYEEWDKASPRSINGMPCFLSCKFVHIDSCVALQAEIDRMNIALGNTPPEEAPDEA